MVLTTQVVFKTQSVQLCIDGIPAAHLIQSDGTGFTDLSDGLPSGDTAAVNAAGDGGRPFYGTSGFVDKRDDYGKLFEDKTLPSKSILILQGKYILTQVKSGLLAVNIRRATERILFERFLQAYSRNGHVTQTALFPVSVQVGVENVLLFQEHAEMLSSLGFDIRAFGNDTVVVNGVPEGYSAEPGKMQALVTDLISVLSDDRSLLPETMASSMAERFARIGAAGMDRLTSAVEAQRLIDSLFSCANAEYTSSGHRTMVILPVEDIDKKF